MPKSKQEKDEIRRQTEAHRQPDKDRSAHEAAREKKMTLADLTKELPGEIELLTLTDSWLAECDRSAAIMASAFVENTLFVMLACNMPDWGVETTKSWFDGPNAPFKSFSAKITLGQAMGIYGPVTTAILNRIRNVRNCFAHRVMPLDFKHPLIVEECRALATNDFLPDAQDPAKTRFCSICLTLGEQFIKDSFEQGGKEIQTRMG